MSRKTPSLSILVPVYNVEKYLEECIDSIVNQTLKNIEIICINDGSTDRSTEILENYARKDKRIKIINKKNTGYGNSMNVGIDATAGEYIGIVESDDFAELNMFETLYKEAKENDLDVARCNFFYYKTSDKSNVKSEQSWVPHNKVYAPADEHIVFHQQPSIWANIYKTSFIKDNEIRFLETPGASYQDTAFSFKVYSLAQRFKMIEAPLLHYRTDNAASSSIQATTKVYCVCDEYHEIWGFVRERELYEKYRYLIPNLQYKGYRWNYNRLAEPYSEEFMKVWREEFTEIFEQGNLSDKVFSKKQYEDALSLILKKDEESESKGPLVSIVVPVYNMEKYLRKCLDSLIKQTLKNIEIICVNDGSTDTSLEILREYESKDSRIKIIDKKNGGLSSARNCGMDATQAEFIGFVDSDDWVELETYRIAYDKIKDVDIVIFGTNVVGDYMMDKRDADNEYYRVKYSGKMELTDSMRLNNDVATWNKLYRKSIIKKYDLKFPVGKLYEDYPFFWNYMFVSENAYFEQKKLYNYLRRVGSIMQQTFAGSPRAIEHLYASQIIYDFLRKNNIYVQHEISFNSIFLNCFWFAYQNADKKTRPKVLKEGTKMVREMELKGDKVFETLKKKQYHKIDRTFIPLKTKTIWWGMSFLRKLTGGGDMTPLESLFPEPISFKPGPTEICNKVPTTEWIFKHENACGIDRWWKVYDENSSDERFNWGHKGGIAGGEDVKVDDLDQKIRLWGTYRALISLDGEKTAFIMGCVLDKEYVVWGTTIYDGIEAHCVSVEVRPLQGTIRIHAYGMKRKKDTSLNCKLLKIDNTG